MTISEVMKWLESAEEGDPYFLELKDDNRAGIRKLLASYERKLEKKRLEFMRHLEKERFDDGYRHSPESLIAGVDEAGRGPLAGPVVTAAVVLPPSCPELSGLDDSKAMSREARERLAALIRKHAVAWSVHVQPAAEIDRLNIYRATRESMEMAVAGLTIRPEAVIADAMKLQGDVPCHSVVKADALSLSVAAASVLAKTERDAYMENLHGQYPAYGLTAMPDTALLRTWRRLKRMAPVRNTGRHSRLYPDFLSEPANNRLRKRQLWTTCDGLITMGDGKKLFKQFDWRM